jgi:hypothetical protein
VSKTWSRERSNGDTVTVTLDSIGAAVMVWRIQGQKECFTLSHEEFAQEYLPWLTGEFDDVVEDIRQTLDTVCDAYDNNDRQIP